MTLSLPDVYAANILDTVRQPLLLLSGDLRVVTANPAFYELCHLTPAEADDQLVYELGHGEWRDTHLRARLEEILPARIELKHSELRQSLPGVFGASSFVTKPVTFEALVGVMNTIGRYWFVVVELPEL